MNRATEAIFGGVVALGFLVGCADDGGPRLDSVTPAASPRNATVTLVGRRLCGASGECATAGGEVQLLTGTPIVRATVVTYEATSIDIVIPPLTPVGTTQLVITVNERASNALDFEVLP